VLLAEQIAYYRARAPEYDETSPFGAQDGPFAAEVGQLRAALDGFLPRGRVLELACGTGQWTGALAEHASEVVALDASVEMIELNRSHVSSPNVRYEQADVFSWSPSERYDVVFFSAWLSHVPPQRFEPFWSLVADCLTPDGRVFVIDELPGVRETETALADAPAPAVGRRLSTGGSYRTVKVFYEPDSLRDRLRGLGWEVEIATVGWRFFYLTGSRAAA
jgi:2-polyprenyl-3-methyl-5-hydroxy-6-metoxy-1,4-benzoquinol methylase